VKIAGIGKDNLRKIEVDNQQSMNPDKLEDAILLDIQSGLVPTCVVAAVGTTGTCAMDPVKRIASICRKYDIWLHIDAAYAGSAMVLPEYRHFLSGIEEADSYVFNPHKWMFTNFDCSAYFVKDKEILIKTFEILPEYLKTRPDSQVNNYRDWGIQLGRRFRALKLWFVIREMGVEGIREKISNHILWAGELASLIKQTAGFKLYEPQNLALVCFSIIPGGVTESGEINRLNLDFLHHLNSSGKIYLSHTKVNGNVLLRMQIGQTSVTREHVMRAWDFIRTGANNFLRK
jgi:aromatic-L-amino-acid decarboxylase